MTSTEIFYVHNPSISDFYWKKRNEGKVHRVALSHVARRLINTIFYIKNIIKILIQNYLNIQLS